MSGALSEAAPAKVNLTLRVVGRRADGYHALESLVVFADLADQLTLTPAASMSLDVGGPFSADCGPTADNLVLKAAGAAGLPAGRFTLNKHIPIAGGLGGGSADAAAALRLIARLNGLPAGDARIVAAARATGADVPVCLEAKARVMRGAGEELSPPLALPKLAAVLVNPGVAVATRDVFAAYSAQQERSSPLTEVPTQAEALVAWLGGHGNDLTRAAIGIAPAIATVLNALGELAGCQLARMSGSGPTCFGLFATASEAASAAQILSRMHQGWWIRAALLG